MLDDHGQGGVPPHLPEQADTLAGAIAYARNIYSKSLDQSTHVRPQVQKGWSSTPSSILTLSIRTNAGEALEQELNVSTSSKDPTRSPSTYELDRFNTAAE